MYITRVFSCIFFWPHGREKWSRPFYLYNHANQFVFYGFWPLVEKRFVLMYDFSWYLWYVYNIGILFVHTKKSAFLKQRYVHNHADQGDSRFFPRRRMTLQWFFSPTPQDVPVLWMFDWVISSKNEYYWKRIVVWSQFITYTLVNSLTIWGNWPKLTINIANPDNCTIFCLHSFHRMLHLIVAYAGIE